VIKRGGSMFQKDFIRKHIIEYITFDLAMLFYIFQFYVYVTLFGHSAYTFLTMFFNLYFLITPILLFFLKSYKEKDLVTRLYVDLYFAISLSMLLISRVIYSTLMTIEWQALLIPIILIFLVLYRVYIYKKFGLHKTHLIWFKIFAILLNLLSLLGLFVHMMFYQG